MKKSILLVALFTLAMSAQAQWFDFSQNHYRFGIGINLGHVGKEPHFNDFGLGVSLNAWGVYLDCLSAGPVYKYDNRVASMNDPANLRFLPDSTTTVVNLGYQIPVLPWLRIMPLIGFNVNTSGLTDMATHNVQTSGSDESISVELYHDYNREYTWTYINFGGGLVITPVKYVDIYAVYTSRAIYGGVSFNMGALFDE